MLLGIALMLPAIAARAATPPADVQAFLARHDQCTHWAGEEPYDRARAAEIATAMRRLRCAAIDADAARLRRAHAGQPALLKLLDAGDDG